MQTRYVKVNCQHVHCCRSLSRLRLILHDSDVASLAMKIAAELAPCSLRLLSPVTSITRSSAASCFVRSITGAMFESRKVVVSIPTTLYPTISFNPPLPPAKQALGDCTILGYNSKMIFVFEEPCWREAGLSGILSPYSGFVISTRNTSVEADH